MIKEILKNSNVKVGECNRCHDEKEVNKFGLCKACQSDVDYEYAMLYNIKDMNY